MRLLASARLAGTTSSTRGEPRSELEAPTSASSRCCRSLRARSAAAIASSTRRRSVMSRANLRGADDPARRVADWRDRHGDGQDGAILAAADGVEMHDRVAPGDPPQHFVFVGVAIDRNNDADRASDGLARGIPEETLRSAVPGRNDTVEIGADDGVVGRVDDRRDVSDRRKW